ncbi:MAG TPA: HAD-IA family hydrolase [Burkholderiaceae bacterium]|nr:HAD-IA family hydrolase [Burkholderiaceae bacterium]
MTDALLRPRIDAVFFDLDGTLADTAADLAAPINAMRIDRGLPPLPVAELRPFASMGARGMIGKGLGVPREAPEYDPLRAEFLLRYEANMIVHTALFDGMTDVLDRLDAAGIRWGVVSNKFERYVRPILERLGVLHRSVAAIGGDTTAYSKPHPEPLLLAARTAGIDPRAAVYVGDDLRDIVAGRAAGMATVAATYGYCGDTPAPPQWGADALIADPRELLPLLRI